MTTDFSYGVKQIVISGPIKPGGKDMPSDARARVDCYADIASIPNPYVGLKITVKVDETNNNKMTDYIVKSLKANSMGNANSAIDEVVRYIDYLGVNSSGGGTSAGTGAGLTSEQAQQLQTAYTHSQSYHVSMDEVNEAIANANNGSNIDTSNLASDLLLTGSSLQLKNNEGALIGNSVSLPNKVSQLTNDLDFASKSYVLSSIENASLGVENDTRLELIMPSESISLVAGVPSTFTFQLPEYVRCAYRISDNCGYITLSGANYQHNGFQFWTSGETSKSMTFTADSSIASNIIDYIYFVPYSSADEDVIKACKLKTFISPSSSTETYGNIIVSTTNLTVPENETTTFTVKLDAAPSTSQNINISVSDSNASVSPSTLTFTSSNYNTPQTVTVTGGHITDSYQDLSTVINVTSGTSTKVISVTVTNIDEAPSTPVIITDVSSLSVNEGANSTFTVNLDKAPTSNVIITLSSTNGNCSLSPSSLTFTTDNYDKRQTVTVTGIQDSNSYSDKTDTITLTSSINDIASKSVSVTVTNIDERPVVNEPATTNLIFHADGRDVDAKSTQEYWNNKIGGMSVTQIPITEQFGSPNTGWNDMTKSYGWIGDSFRYYLVSSKQPSVTFNEITDNYTICVGFVQEDMSEKFYQDSQRKIWHNENSPSGSGNKHSLFMKSADKGKLTQAFGTIRAANILNTQLDVNAPSEPILMHYYTSVNFTDKTINVLANGNSLTTTINGDVTNPRNIFTLARGTYTSPIRIYYLRVYNKALTNEEMIELYNIENTIERSVE